MNLTIEKTPVYKRVLLKISGEGLQGDLNYGIEFRILNKIVAEIKHLIKLGIQIGIVIGGGNLFRGKGLSKNGMNRVIGDHIGMLSTIINGLALYDAFNHAGIKSILMSTFTIPGVCRLYNSFEAKDLLNNNIVVILSSGIGNPLFTTDSAACLRGIEIEANIMLKATKVNGIYSNDPVKNPNCILYNTLTYQEVLQKELKIMDLTAFILARDHKLPICVFNLNKNYAMYHIVMGYKEGTLITD